MYAVYDKTINNYARGKHERININLDLFTQISEMQHPEQLDLIDLQPVIKHELAVNAKNYQSVIKFFENNGGIVE